MAKKFENVEEEMKIMLKPMGGSVRTILDLKAKVEVLENKLVGDKYDELGDVLEKQKHLDNAIAANSIAIERIDDEMKKYDNIGKDILGKHNDESSQEVAQYRELKFKMYLQWKDARRIYLLQHQT